MSNQLELFTRDPMEPLFPYWRESLRACLDDVWHFRHNRNTTGWSMATQGLSYAGWLYQHGQINRTEFRRWWKFFRRARRLDQTDNNLDIEKQL